MPVKKIVSSFSKLSPNVFKSYFDLGREKRSYRQLRSILFSAMFGMAILPLMLAGGIGYYNYKDLLEVSEEEQFEWQLDGSAKSIENMVDSLISIILFAAKNDRYLELLNDDQLKDLFIRIQTHYPLLADLGVIDEKGIQQAYRGSYDLQGANYSEEEWFKNIFTRRVYVSDVYEGIRGVPHFAIAVAQHDPRTNSNWVLRATIDAVTLQQFTSTIKTMAAEDLFLVNNQGIIQTSSLYFGERLSKFKYSIAPGIQHSITSSGEEIFKAVAAIEGSPWNLVLVKKRYIHDDDWKKFQRRLLQIIISSSVISLIVTLTLVRLLTNLTRKSDENLLAMAKEAEHTNKLASIGRLAAGVGHEINNPLAIIDQKVGLIEDLIEMSDAEFPHKHTVSSSLKSVNDSVDRCKAITHRLLGFARRNVITSEEVDVNVVVEEVLQFLDNSMIYNRIKLELNLEENLHRIQSDRVQLQQIFLNIINNAIDAVGKNGRIDISTQSLDSAIKISLNDNGPGIAEEMLNKIFEPFYTTKETGKGTGLGLSITYGLVKKLGGDINVQSQIDHGTTFTITFPIKSVPNEPTEQ